MAPKTKTKPVRLTTAQTEIVGQMNDLSFENPKLTFEQVAKKALGPNPFPRTANGEREEVREGVSSCV